MLGSISKVFPEGLVHNVNCMFRVQACWAWFWMGWWGGVTRGVKNCDVLLDRSWSDFDGAPGPHTHLKSDVKLPEM